jgi:hypothetical protein
VTFRELDPFDLPEWVGDGPVTWTAERGLEGHLVAGRLTGGSGQELSLDLLAVDQAYPAPVLDEAARTHVHQSWRHGQVSMLSNGERPTVAAPGTSWTADAVLNVLTRVTKAVGADPSSWSVRFTLSDKRER